ncbi:hypothetical protein CLOM_g903, partial [Closterium sp. NIES-68]
MDFEGNTNRIIASIREAKARGASYRIGPELEINGLRMRGPLPRARHVPARLGVLGCNHHQRRYRRHPVRHRPTSGAPGRALQLPRVRPRPSDRAAAAQDGPGERRQLPRDALVRHVEASWRAHGYHRWLRQRVRGRERRLLVMACWIYWTARWPVRHARSSSPPSPHIRLALAGAEVVGNGSGSHHELRKLGTR